MIPVAITLSQWSTDDGTFYTGIYRDISKRLELEAQLESQKLALDEHAIVSISDIKGNITYVNEKFCKISGYSASELMGQNHRIVSSGYHPKEFFDDLWKTISSGVTWNGTIKNRTRSGKNYWVKASIVPFLNEKGQPYQYVAIRTDVTDRINSEQSLREALELNKIVISSLPNGVTIFDGEGNCLETNTAMAEIIGSTKEHLLKINYHDIESWKKSGVYEYALKAISTNTAQHFDVNYTTTYGKNVYIEMYFTPFIVGGKTRLFHSITDISDRKEAEDILAQDRNQLEIRVNERTRELQMAMDEVVRANQIKSEFMANMSHELRTPLNAIIGFSDMISNQYLGPIENDQYVDYGKDIGNSSKKLMLMIEGILTLEEASTGKTSISKKHVNIGAIINDSLLSVRSNMDKHNISLGISIPDDLKSIYVDENASIKVLNNLLSNAVKFSKDGGEINLVVEHKDGQHIIHVMDKGIGIAKDMLASVTAPFSRHEQDPHKAYDGLGLGLAISKSLVELHNGELVIDSELGKGTTVTIMFPDS
jgi:PAS domain S-box-containing protein